MPDLSVLFSDIPLITDQTELAPYACDWTKKYEPHAQGVLLPRNTEEVARAVRIAYENDIAIVPSGGRTGLSGGAVAYQGEVVIALDRMNKVLDFNAVDRLLTVQAGMVTQSLQEEADERGLFYPVDFASAGSSQIGGNISTNAGGIKVIRWGMTREWVAGLTVVTGTGEVLHLNQGLAKNNTGYDFRHLFIGAEGTLGIVTEATMRLTRIPKALNVMVLGVNEFSAIMDILGHFQQEIDLSAFEFFSHNSMHYTQAHGVQAPFATPAPYYALLEFENVSEQSAELAMAAFEHCVEQGWVLDGVMSQSEAQAQQLWQLRERISESIAPKTPYKNDISVRVSDVPEFIAEVDAIVSKHYPDFEIVWFGHIGDGNVHLNILKPDALAKEAFFEKCAEVSVWIFEALQRYNGSVSAEHGVGLLKKEFLAYTRSSEEIALMQQMKAVFDPKGLMNPGKLIDLPN